MAFKRKDNGGDGARPLPGVTSENYLNTDGTGKAVEYAKADGKCFMIQPDMAPERRAWVKYYQVKGMSDRMMQMRWWLDGHHNYTKHYAVPAQWPWQFDQSVSEEQCC